MLNENLLESLNMTTILILNFIIVAQGHKRVAVTRRLSVQSPLGGMNYCLLMELIIFTTQCFEHSVKGGERSILTLGSLFLPYYIRDKA